VVVTQIKEAALSTGLVINESTTKYIKINRNITNLEHNLRMDIQVFEGFQNFRYVGALINSKNLTSDEMDIQVFEGFQNFNK
jgi:hypothetical protein